MADAAADAGRRVPLRHEVTGLRARPGGRVTACRTTADGERPIERRRGRYSRPTSRSCYRLLGRAPRRLVPLRWSPSAVVLHAGLARVRPGRSSAHHTISFGAAWERTFDEII